MPKQEIAQALVKLAGKRCEDSQRLFVGTSNATQALARTARHDSA